jgi:hypothetical protein
VPFCDTRPQSDSSAEITPQTLAKWCEQVTIVAPTIDVKNSGADPPAAIHVACKTQKEQPIQRQWIRCNYMQLQSIIIVLCGSLRLKTEQSH